MMLNTPAQIEHYRLAAMRGALKLEAIGLRHSRMRSMRKPAALAMGLNPSAKIPEIIEALEVKMKELEAKIGNG